MTGWNFGSRTVKYINGVKHKLCPRPLGCGLMLPASAEVFGRRGNGIQTQCRECRNKARRLTGPLEPYGVQPYPVPRGRAGPRVITGMFGTP